MKKQITLLAILFLIAGLGCKKDKPKVAPQEGLISYFNFDDNLKDQQGYVNDGVGNATFTAGKIGKALSFNGIDQKMVFTQKNPTANSQISISCWINKKPANDQLSVLGTTNFQLQTGGGDLYFLVFSQLNNTYTWGAIMDDQWIHVVSTYDGASIKIYLNGTLAGEKSTALNISGFNTDLIMAYDGSNYWAGSIDELYIYNRALTQAEVTQLYNLK